MSAIIPFDFEEQAVRVIMRDDEPWFVAADVCRVLEVSNSRDALSRLDDDEKGVVTADTLGGQQQMNIISESGLYALIFTSRKPEAKKFRKWVTSEVLPSIRRSGRYETPLKSETGPMREIDQWLGMVREARLLGGTHAGRSIWKLSPLPPLPGMVASATRPVMSEADGRDCLAYLMDQDGDAVAAARAGEDDSDDLAYMGLRARTDGLFVSNRQLDLFMNSAWDGGAHRAALLALNGAFVSPVCLTLAGQRTRGVIVPWALIDDYSNGEVVQ